MIKLKGVIILRISDFRRFFDLGEFFFKKEDFISLFKQEIYRRVESPTKPLEEYFFVNDAKEFLLLQKTYDWLINPSKELLKVKMDKTEVKIEANDGNLFVYPLGRLKDYIEDVRKQNQLTNKEILGLTLLYLLLNANESNSDINIIYDNALGNINVTKKDIKEFEFCWEDIELEKIESPIFPLRRCVLINKNMTKDIKVRFRDKELLLKPNECVVGLFSQNKCLILLDNVVSDYNSNVTLKLSVNGSSPIPRCEIHSATGINYIKDVSSIAMEPDGDIIYSTFDGKINYNHNSFRLDLRINSFLKKDYSSDLIGFKKDISGNYIFYTTNKIDY